MIDWLYTPSKSKFFWFDSSTVSALVPVSEKFIVVLANSFTRDGLNPTNFFAAVVNGWIASSTSSKMSSIVDKIVLLK